MARTDVHSPAHINPSDYRFLTSFYQGDSEDAAEAYADENNDWMHFRTQYATYPGNFQDKTTCDHCGAYFAYGACYLYIPLNYLIHVGHTCANETLTLPDRFAVDQRNLKRKAEALKARRILAAKVALFYAEHPNIAALKEGYQTSFVQDVLGKLEIYGELSERQVAALETAYARRQQRAEEEAAKQAESNEPVLPCPTGRVSVTGIILSFKEVEVQVGYHTTYVTKMLVRDLRGFKVYGTLPRSLDANIGDSITFTANLEASCKDPQFGFFKRPTKASRN